MHIFDRLRRKHGNGSGAEIDDGFESVTFSTTDGLRLCARDYGRGLPLAHPGRMPVVCLPGLTRNSRDFHRLALALSCDDDDPRRVVTFDYRGRGRSEWDASGSSYTLPVETEDVLSGMSALGLGEAAFIGTSRGALIIHMLAAVRPGAILAAVLNDAGPVIGGSGLVQIKAHLERMPAPADWRHAAALLQEAYGRSFPLLGEEDWKEMAASIFRQRDGRIVADYDPALLKQLRGLDLNTPVPTLWPQFDGLKHVPLMVVRGENSDLLSEDTVQEMACRHPGMTAVLATGQGHPPVLHLDRLDAKIAAFLRANDPR